MDKCFVASTLANDPHTEGLHNAGRIAALAGIYTVLLKPSMTLDALCQAIKDNSPTYLGLSYRLSPKIGCQELEKALYYFRNSGLIKPESEIKIWFAGLPETIDILRGKLSQLPLPLLLCEPYPNAIDRVKETIELFDIIDDKERILEQLREEVQPKGIELFDQLADEVIANDIYKAEPPLAVPSLQAQRSYIDRIHESKIPLLRSHFGIPANDIEPTVEGIRTLAEARVLDEISLGSSDLSQRYFGYPEMFVGKKNDGGVPYKTYDGKGSFGIYATYFEEGSFILYDGSLVRIYHQNWGNTNCIIAVDVNGFEKNPNRAGYDVFVFELTNDGKILPEGAPGSSYEIKPNLWDGHVQNSCSSKFNNNGSNGVSCTYKALTDKDYFKNLR